MKTTVIWCAALALAAGPLYARQDSPATSPAPQSSQKEPKPRPPIYDEAADAHEQIESALARAKKDNQRVLIQWGANWCGWCHLLHDTFRNDEGVKKELLYEYRVVLVDVGQFNKHTAIAEKYGAEIKSGIPYLTVLDADGKVLANQETGSLEAKTPEGKNGHDAAKVLAFLKTHEAAPQVASNVLDEGLAKAQAQNKKVFLHFGAPWCGWCHRLEDWSARPDIAPILAKDFIDVKIDVERTTGGKDALSRYNSNTDSGIPWFVILTPDGKPVITSDGPKGNVGFPATDPEIDHFIAMMKKSTRTMSATEIDTLKATLVEEREKTKR